MAIPTSLVVGAIFTLVSVGCGAGGGVDADAVGDIVDQVLNGGNNGGQQVTLDTPQLPTTMFDYETYADDLPPHFFTQTSQINTGSVVEQDNTPEGNPITNAGATLGRVLFYDVKLSANDTTACASCHTQDTGFGDRRRLSIGFDGGQTGRHSPSLTNAGFYKRGHFFWDERADTLEIQTLMPIQDAVEMGMSLDVLEVKLQNTEYYPALFQDAFGSPLVTRDGISRALAQFVRSMVSYQSKFDEMMTAGPGGTPDLSVFTEEERLGLRLFGGGPEGNDDSVGCHFCHDTTAHVSSNIFNNGLDAVTTDQGASQGQFKSPSLRNIAVSAPYMHDGRFNSLNAVVNFYNNGVQDNPDLAQGMRDPDTGLPRRLGMNRTERDALVAFMRTLTDNTFLTAEMFSDPFPRQNGGNNGGGNNGGGGQNPPPPGGQNPPPPGGGGGNGGGGGGRR